MRFAGKLALITGAASGIGAATAEQLAAEGARVIAADINAERLAELAQRLRAAGGAVETCAFDAGSESGWQAAAALVADLGGGLDVLVNNAFTLELKPIHELSLESWQRQLQVDLTSVYLGAHAFVEQLCANRGAIVNVASVHAVIAWRGHPAYAAAKGGVLALTRQLAVEYGPALRVNAVLPGPILTPLWNDVSDEGRRSAAGETALDRMGTAAEVAAVITFLASDEASYVTGASLAVDGGQTVKSRG